MNGRTVLGLYAGEAWEVEDHRAAFRYPEGGWPSVDELRAEAKRRGFQPAQRAWAPRRRALES